MGCDPRCNAKLCAISNTEQCAITYQPENKEFVKNYKSVFEQMLKEYNKKLNEQLQPKTKG